MDAGGVSGSLQTPPGQSRQRKRFLPLPPGTCCSRWLAEQLTLAGTRTRPRAVDREGQLGCCRRLARDGEYAPLIGALQQRRCGYASACASSLRAGRGHGAKRSASSNDRSAWRSISADATRRLLSQPGAWQRRRPRDRRLTLARARRAAAGRGAAGVPVLQAVRLLAGNTRQRSAACIVVPAPASTSSRKPARRGCFKSG
jgi:hypothetical protein